MSFWIELWDVEKTFYFFSQYFSRILRANWKFERKSQKVKSTLCLRLLFMHLGISLVLFVVNVRCVLGKWASVWPKRYESFHQKQITQLARARENEKVHTRLVNIITWKFIINKTRRVGGITRIKKEFWVRFLTLKKLPLHCVQYRIYTIKCCYAKVQILSFFEKN